MAIKYVTVPLSTRVCIDTIHQETKIYIGVKMVKAIQMTRQEYNDFRHWELPADEDGSDEGYMVIYANDQSNVPGIKGYVSWSPKDVFEQSHALVNTEE